MKGSRYHTVMKNMDYNKWANEYLAEAEEIKEYIGRLRNQVKEANAERKKELYSRITILYSMYLELNHTGKYLLERGGESYGEQKAIA
ncbi:MAG: hypothetical protein Q8876_06130 [Bacillota bacterium]|nr:hypothetical protein [Bacillota bacterium]